jgi:hypothetical protein
VVESKKKLNHNEIHQLISIVYFAPFVLKLVIIHEYRTYLGKTEDGFPEAIQMVVHGEKQELI